MSTCEVTAQGFQAVSRRRSEIAKHGGVVELHQLATSDAGYVSRKSLWNTSLIENQLCERSAEAPNHRCICIMI
jgi:hypothetical protein